MAYATKDITLPAGYIATIEQSGSSSIHTNITVNRIEIENSTGGTDCWLGIDEVSDAELIDYITCKISDLAEDAAEVIKLIESGEEEDNEDRLGMSLQRAKEILAAFRPQVVA